MSNIKSLQTHLDNHKNMLNSAVPKRHQDSAEEYRAYLKLEISRTEKKLEELSLAGVKIK